MSVLAIGRQFLVTVIILFCTALAAALSLGAAGPASTDTDVIQLTGNEAISQLQPPSSLLFATCGSLRSIILNSCPPSVSVLVEGSAANSRIEDHQANITGAPAQSASNNF